MYKYQIVLGDWSEDGHGKTDTYFIQSAKKLNELQKTYENFVEETNYCFDNRYHSGKKLTKFLTDYGNFTIKMQDFKQIIGQHYEEYKNKTDHECIEDDDEKVYFYPDSFMDFFIFLMNKRSPALELKVINNEIPTWNTGMGYGLYE